MYHLTCANKLYRWLHETPDGVQASGWSSTITLEPVFHYTYETLENALCDWPKTITIFSTEDPSTILQTHPELFL